MSSNSVSRGAPFFAVVGVPATSVRNVSEDAFCVLYVCHPDEKSGSAQTGLFEEHPKSVCWASRGFGTAGMTKPDAIKSKKSTFRTVVAPPTTNGGASPHL